MYFDLLLKEFAPANSLGTNSFKKEVPYKNKMEG